jgi:hypothetical protein
VTIPSIFKDWNEEIFNAGKNIWHYCNECYQLA